VTWKKEIGWEWLDELPEPIEIEVESFEMLGSWRACTKKPAGAKARHHCKSLVAGIGFEPVTFRFRTL
jgi:hypothetical protein